MLHRLLFLALLAALVGVALWDIARRNPGLFPRPRKPGPRPRPRLLPTPAPAPAPATRGGQVLAFGRPPHEVLGLSPDAPLEAAEEAYLRLRAAVASESQETLDEDARADTARQLQELDRAVAALRRRLG